MKKITKEKRALVIKCLTDGAGVNATSRITGVNKRTVLRLLCDVGQICQDYHDLVVRNLKTTRIQADEVWAFCHSKQANVRDGNRTQYKHGDVWCWSAIDSDSKLVVTWHVGWRQHTDANIFAQDIASRVSGKIQISTDSLNSYFYAIRSAFGEDGVDYATINKIYADRHGEIRYSPPKCIGCKKVKILGNPEQQSIQTSHVERLHLTNRMNNRRMTRLTLGFSKKFENHVHAMALTFFSYNFIKKHNTLGMTPAQAAGVTDKAWTVEELVDLLESEERKISKGGRINKEDMA